MESYGNNTKEAFAEGVTVYHKDGKTPIKRVRINQSKTTLNKLASTKYGAKDKQDKVFKWLAYGNLHHVEIIRNKKSGKFTGIFVTMMEASHRIKGINMPKQPIIKTEHGEQYEFMMPLHINDLVSVEKNGVRLFYRVQKLEQPSVLELRLHRASTLTNDSEKIRKSISTLFQEYKLQKHQSNVLGKLIE